VQDRPRLGLVVGSGGLKCAAMVGLWEVLDREGITADVVVGCSGGSIYATSYALGRLSPAEAREHSVQLWRQLRAPLCYRSLVRMALPRLFGSPSTAGLLNDRSMMAIMGDLFGGLTFADTRAPLHLATSDLITGETVILSDGSLLDAVRASISLPLLFPPWPVDGRLLIDGGVSNPLPIDVAMRAGCDVIIAMGFEQALYPELGTFTQMVSQATSITTNHLLRSTYAFYSSVHHAEIIPIMPSFDVPVHLRDGDLVPHIIDQGARATEEELPYLRRILGMDQPAVHADGTGDGY
jgi:NTE family protein